MHARALRDGPRARSTAGPSPSAARTSPSAAARAGRGDRKKGGQGGFVEDLAASYRIPLVNLIDGAGGSVTSINKRGHTVFPGVHGFERSVELLGKVPVVCAVLGTAAGGPAGRAILSHWSVMVEGTSQVFAAGPPVVERSLGQKLTKEELGGPQIAVDIAGTIDNRVANEDDVLRRRSGASCPTCRRTCGSCRRRSPATDPVDRCDDELARASCRATGASPTTCGS